MSDTYLTLKQVCTRFHCSDRRAREIVKRHRIPVLCHGREWLFDENALSAFVEAGRMKHKPLPGAAPVQLPGSGRSRSPSAQNAYETALALTRTSTPKRSHRK